MKQVVCMLVEALGAHKPKPSTSELDLCDGLCAELAMVEVVPCSLGSGKASLHHK